MSELYDTDILSWSEHQARRLRRVATGERINDLVDWPNVIEEIESVGNEQLHAVESLLVQALRHIRIHVPGLYADAVRALPESIDEVAPLPVPPICPVTLEELLAEPPDAGQG
jgi:uncharacterized protein DUF29